MTSKSVLFAIQARDPDGGEVQPTEADYRAFKALVIAIYGTKAYHTYMHTAWNQPEEF